MEYPKPHFVDKPQHGGVHMINSQRTPESKPKQNELQKTEDVKNVNQS